MSTLARRAQVVAQDDEIAERFRGYLRGLDYEVGVEQEVRTDRPAVDLLVYHVPRAAMQAERRQKARPRRPGDTFPRSWLEAVQTIARESPGTQILVAVEPGETTADRAIDSGATDVIESTVTPGVFRRRIQMLEAIRKLPAFASLPVDPVPPEARAAARATAREQRLLELPLPELRNERSGRIDAQAVATYLGVPLKRLAKAVGLKYAGLHKTPDSVRAQDALQPVVRVLELANRAFGDAPGTADTVRRWLNRPLEELDDDSPLTVILVGEAGAVETLLKNALTGIPV